MTPTPSIIRPFRRLGLLGCGAGILFLPLPLAAEIAPPVPPPLVDSLSQNDLQIAFRALRGDALARGALTDLTLNRAALAGLLAMLGPEAEILPSAPAPESAPPPTNLIAPLPGGITYIRPAVFDDALFRELRELPKADAGLVLDLRLSGGDLDAARAARLASHFCPPGSHHFSLVDAGNAEIERHTQDAGTLRRPGALAILVDSRTGPSAETVAAVLRFHERKRCLLLGEPTSGRAAVYRSLALGDRARLRFATAGVRLPDGSPLFGKGLVPDVPVASDPAARDALLGLSDPAGLAALLTEPERPALNEAALIEGINPELPELLRTSAPQPSAGQSPPLPLPDPALRQAIDFLTTRHFLAPRPDDRLE